MRRFSCCLLALALGAVVFAGAGCPSKPKVPPTAAFGASPKSGIAPLTVSFSDESTAGSSAITSRLWNFGDGQTSTAQEPQHVYGAGVYSVSLTVTSSDGTDTETKDAFIHVGEPGQPFVQPVSGTPGAMVKITVPGDVLDADAPANNVVYFGDQQMLPANVTADQLTTAVPPLADPAAVTIRVEVSGTVVASGLGFEILPPPVPSGPPGTVAADVQNDVIDMVATTLNELKPLIEAAGPKADDGMQQALAAFADQMDALKPLTEYARQKGELQLLDDMLVSSGFADEIKSINHDFKKRLAMAKAMDAEDWAGGAKAKERFLPARYRFVVDCLGARLHLAMEFANVAVTALSTAASFAPTGTLAFGGAAVIGDIVVAMVNLIVVYIEAVPVELVPDSLTGTVGAHNALAANSSARAVFMGDFVAEKNVAQSVFALYFPGIGHGLEEALGIPRILMHVLQEIGSELFATAEHPEEHKYVFPAWPPDPDMPIYTFEFMEKFASNPPSFDGGSVATLKVDESRIYSHDEEGGPFDLVATQKIYRFKGGFFSLGDPPRIEKEEASCTVPVTVKKGLKLTVQEPDLPDPIPPGDLVCDLVGDVENWDGSPADDAKVTITVEIAGETYVEHPTGGEFEITVTVPPGKNTVTVTGDDGETTATEYIIVLNAALPETYCVVSNVSGDSLSLIDPARASEFLRIASADVDGVLDGPRDMAFLPDGETLLVLNSTTNVDPNMVALKLTNSIAASSLSMPMKLGAGKSWSMALTPDSKTALVTCWNGASALHVVDVRQPDALRLVDTIDCSGYNTYGTARVCTASISGDRTVAVATTGNYTASGPTKLLVFDVTNPYNVLGPGVLSVPISSGAIAPIPGHALAVVAGVSLFDSAAHKVDSTVLVVDFADPDHPALRGKLDVKGAYLFGLAVTADGSTAYVTDAGNPLTPSNRLLALDISNPDAIKQRTAGYPLSFGGTASARMALSPDGHTAVVPNGSTNTVTVIDLSNPAAPTAGDPFDLDVLPFGVTFNMP